MTSEFLATQRKQFCQKIWACAGLLYLAAQLLADVLAKHKIPQVRQASYSPDMAPCDFWLFHKLKMHLKGSRFESREAIKSNAMKRLLVIPKTDFEKCFQQCKVRWAKYVQTQGTYFEGD